MFSRTTHAIGVILVFFLCSVLPSARLGADAKPALPLNPASPPVVVIDAAKHAATQVPENVKTRFFRSAKGGLNVYIMNAAHKSVTVTVKVGGLTADAYDLFLNGTRESSLTRQQLEAGFPVKLPEFEIPTWQLQYIRRVNDSIRAVRPKLESDGPQEVGIARDVLTDVLAYNGEIARSVMAWRSTRVTLMPADAAAPAPVVIPQADLEMQRKYIDAHMLYFNWVREELCKLIPPGDVRNLAVTAVAPLDVKCEFPQKIKPKSKFLVTVMVTNCMDRAVNVTPVFMGGSKWTFKPKKSGKITGLGAQKSAKLEFIVIAPKDAASAAQKPPQPILKVDMPSKKKIDFVWVHLPEPPPPAAPPPLPPSVSPETREAPALP